MRVCVAARRISMHSYCTPCCRALQVIYRRVKGCDGNGRSRWDSKLATTVVTGALRTVGPGKPYTAREQAEMLFELAGREPKFISVPVGLMDFIIGAMETIGKVIPSIGVREPQSAPWPAVLPCQFSSW